MYMYHKMYNSSSWKGYFNVCFPFHKLVHVYHYSSKESIFVCDPVLGLSDHSLYKIHLHGNTINHAL